MFFIRYNGRTDAGPERFLPARRGWASITLAGRAETPMNR